MSVPIPLRGDFRAYQLRGLAKKTKDGPQARRLLALAVIYDGAPRTEAAKIGGGRRSCTPVWVARVNSGGPRSLAGGKTPEPPPQPHDNSPPAKGPVIAKG